MRSVDGFINHPLAVAASQITVRLYARTVIWRSGGVGYCMLGWAWTSTAWAEGRRRTLKAIHTPLITSSTAPAGTVGGVAWAPIVIAYTIPKTYINTGANAHSAPAHLGRMPER